ncbi:similar to metallopeptidase family M24 containing protein, expressed [Ectocarpus siliculosus]|uniref:Similar to metallopeptidase family M24 containing protein, expressed n=1 Tax=Ectocarpus siliculosus TaxID=2880 RepID=D8LFA8_ECTSI|nr:similar to metallopeptidase family M24 containing protein, expressed [Ectocarpus siliculosus]|eukprot:CBN78833.1 similar to metallopeptidase family M24 containing protein, expressed [Ectocarpus siliculosus]
MAPIQTKHAFCFSSTFMFGWMMKLETFLFRDVGCNFLKASMTSSGLSFSSSHLEHVTIVWSHLRGKTLALLTPCIKLIDVSLLTTQEREWLDDYHATVLATLGPLLKDNAEAFAYLVRETRPLEKSC